MIHASRTWWKESPEKLIASADWQLLSSLKNSWITQRIFRYSTILSRQAHRVRLWCNVVLFSPDHRSLSRQHLYSFRRCTSWKVRMINNRTLEWAPCDKCLLFLLQGDARTERSSGQLCWICWWPPWLWDKKVRMFKKCRRFSQKLNTYHIHLTLVVRFFEWIMDKVNTVSSDDVKCLLLKALSKVSCSNWGLWNIFREHQKSSACP